MFRWLDAFGCILPFSSRNQMEDVRASHGLSGVQSHCNFLLALYWGRWKSNRVWGSQSGNWTPQLTRCWMTGEVEPDQLPPRLVSDMTSFSFFVNSKIWCTQIAMKLREIASRRLCTVLGRLIGCFCKRYLGENIFAINGNQ